MHCIAYRKTELIAGKTSFGWGRANFFHSVYTVWYGAMFWVCAGNIRDIFIFTEQYFHRVKTFSAFNPTPPAREVGVHMELGESTARTADPADHRDIP